MTRTYRKGSPPGEAVPTREGLLEAMGKPGFPPSSLREIHRRLKIHKKHRMVFKRLVRDLVSEGRLVRVGKSHYALPREDDTVEGRVQRHADGFGFVVPDAGQGDLYVHPRNLESIFHGDRVKARIIRRHGHGRDEAVIVKVLEPSGRRVMGIYHGGKGGNRVEAFERSYATGILIGRGESRDAKEGQVVGVEVIEPPSSREPARGRIVEVLGYPDAPGMDLRTVVRKHELREAFPPEVLAEAARFPDPIPEEEISRREDFRGLPIVTIDGQSAMDFDDAVRVERLEGGAFRLEVHIADVAHYVRQDSALDREALLRGTSVYFPGSAIPMLPPRLSSGLCSLNPGVDRLTLSVILEIDSHGRIRSRRFAEGVIRSVERMTYTDVAKILEEEDPAVCGRYRSLVDGFRRMEELAAVLNGKRRRRGTIDFDLPEPEILLDLQGGTLGIVPLRRNVAHRIIEEFMLAANEAVAGSLLDQKVPSLYRIHEKPDPRKIGQLNEVLGVFGHRLPEPLEAVEPSHFQEILDRLEGKPELRFLSRIMLRSMKLARYSAEKGIHFGLGASTYTHFTSPIRRYPDLMVHRILREVLSGGRLPEERREWLRRELPEIALQSSRTERTADEAEWEVVEWKKLAYMAERVGETFDGFISSVASFGFFVEISELFVEGLVHVSTLPADRYRFLERRHVLKGERTGATYRIGAPFRVRVDRVDLPQRRLDFSPADDARPRRRGGRGRS
jgi:ribonuclease R